MKELYSKLHKLHEMKLSFKKTAENPFFKSKYLPLDELVKTLLPALNKLKLIIVHSTHGEKVVTKVIDTESGQAIKSFFPFNASLEPQKVGSAITYAKRYNIGQLLNIVTDEDDDGNATSPQNTTETAKVAGKGVCSVCGTQSLISYKKDPAGVEYCPKLCWKKSPNYKIVDKESYDREKEFLSDMDADPIQVD